MREVRIFLEISDSGAAPADHNVSCHVTSSQPDDTIKSGDGNPCGDVNGADAYNSPVAVPLAFDVELQGFTGTVLLRAERDASDCSRIYAVTCDVSDPSGNRSMASCVVLVPQSAGRK